MTSVKRKISGKKISKKKITKKKLTKRGTTAFSQTGRPRIRRETRRGTSLDGFVQSPAGVYVPTTAMPPVPASKLAVGIGKASKELRKLVRELMQAIGSDLKIREIELAVSFSADGKFLGIGVGGAATVTLKLAPEDGE